MTPKEPQPMQLEEVGYWSEIKLDIIREYAQAYSKIMSSPKQKQHGLSHIYVDAFAGAGKHISKTTKDEIEGSPIIAANTIPSFTEYHFIDLNGKKVEYLRKLFADRGDVFIHEGNCNSILLKKVFPKLQFADYRRGLCLLDPYGLHLNWEIIHEAGRLKTIDMFLNFPVADMNRNVFWRNPNGVAQEDILRMNAFWGDDSWRNAAYKSERGLFGPIEEKTDNESVVAAFRDRLKKVAGFSNVPSPIPMRNKNKATVYYLFFASQKPVAGQIVSEIFDKYRNRGA